LARLPSKLIVIAGGEGKGQDFTELNPVLQKNPCHLVLIGRDAPIIAEAVKNNAEIDFASSMQDAINKAFARAKSGDAVLLSPACASFDMFKNYEDRGEQFCAAVLALQDTISQDQTFHDQISQSQTSQEKESAKS
jgi:UDP-N-acetylmuramoylalanine--D-glutamate ligase